MQTIYASTVFFRHLSEKLELKQATIATHCEGKLTNAILFVVQQIQDRIRSFERSEINQIVAVKKLMQRWDKAMLTHRLSLLRDVLTAIDHRGISSINYLDYQFLMGLTDEKIKNVIVDTGLSDRTISDLFSMNSRGSKIESIILIIELFCSEDEQREYVNTLCKRDNLEKATTYVCDNKTYVLSVEKLKELEVFISGHPIHSCSPLSVIRGIFVLLREVELDYNAEENDDFNFHRIAMSYLRCHADIIICISEKYNIKDALFEAIEKTKMHNSIDEKPDFETNTEAARILYVSIHDSAKIHQIFHQYIGGQI